MKQIAFSLLLSATVIFSRSQTAALSYLNDFSDSTVALMDNYFREIKQVCAGERAGLWGLDLYGPILLVDPVSRKVFANMPDKKGVLAKYEFIYAGFLPAQILLANTATEWAGVKWTMVLLPLPPQRDARIRLLSHELFHRIQDGLGLPAKSPNCDHLDTKDGRVYFRLELAALSSALRKPAEARREDLTNALLFRKYRYRLVLDTAAEQKERELEFNEGLAEFTGVYVSGSANDPDYLAMTVDSALNYTSFTRSFAYLTGPLYGTLLSQKQPGWQRKIGLQDNFPDLLTQVYGLSLPPLSPGEIVKRAYLYHYDRIAAEEQAREDIRLSLEKKYLDRLVNGPVLEIPLVNMNFSFNPTNLFSLGKYGTVYPDMTVNDDWGKIVVSNGGALLKGDWKTLYIRITQETGKAGSLIRGDGWELDLKDGWAIVPGSRQGDFKLAKRD